MACTLLINCEYFCQCDRFPGKPCLRNDLLYVEWDALNSVDVVLLRGIISVEQCLVLRLFVRLIREI